MPRGRGTHIAFGEYQLVLCYEVRVANGGYATPDGRLSTPDAPGAFTGANS